MRISSEKGDEGYALWSNLISVGSRIKVFFHDKEVTGICYMADSDKNLITRGKLNSEGQMYMVGLELAKETVSGDVRIEVERSAS